MSKKLINEAPWMRGRLLDTALTRRFRHAESEAAHKQEQCRVFAWFSEADQGRSRELVCVCDDPGQALAIVKEHNEFLEVDRELKEKDEKAQLLDMRIASLISESGELKARIAELEAQVPKWISVEDELPDVGAVIGLYRAGHMNTVYCGAVHDGLAMWYACIDDEDIKAPTHWMPLPAPPKEGE